MKTEWNESGATISDCGRYRYRLWREWRGTHDPKNWFWADGKDGNGAKIGEPKACVFIMLNPSTADGTEDDPTIRRCVGFAKSWNYERLEVVNLFAYRATEPKQLFGLDLDTAVGPENHEFVDDAVCRAGIVVCAWGGNGTYLGQDQTVLGWCGPRRTFAIAVTAGGQPRHPLYLKSGLLPLPWPKDAT